MLKTKPILRFLLLCCTAYIFLWLLFSIQPIAKQNSSFFQNLTQLCTNSAFPKVYTEVESKSIEEINEIFIYFTSIKMFNHKNEVAKKNGKTSLDLTFWSFNIHLHNFWTMPLIFLLSLILATPIPKKAKSLALISGVFFLLIYIVLKLYVYSYFRFHEKAMGVYEISPSWLNFILRLKSHMAIGATVAYVVLVWMLVTFKHLNWKKLLKPYNLPRKNKG